MTVVTDATIREVSGETMADFLRHVPGVKVSQTAARDVNVTPRAATGTLSDSLLVLLDGRSIYQDLFGSVLKLRGFVNALDGNVRAALLQTPEGNPFESSFENQAYDVEASDLHLVGSQHVVSYGGNYRYNNFDISIAPRGTHRSEGGAYVQDEIVFSESGTAGSSVCDSTRSTC